MKSLLCSQAICSALNLTQIPVTSRRQIRGGRCMTGSARDAEFTVASRYTHVFIDMGAAGWQLVSAQGTPIAG